MKVILLAGGKSVRMQPLTDKCFVRICGKPLIEWQLGSLSKAGFKKFVIVGNAKNVEVLRQIKLPGIKIQVVQQSAEKSGMHGAMMAAKKAVIDEDAVLVVSSNDVVEDALWKKVKQQKGKDGFLVGYRVSRYFPGGYLKVDSQGKLQSIVEKPGEGNEPSDLVNLVIHLHRDVPALYGALEGIQSMMDDQYERALQSLFDRGKRFTVLPYQGFWQAVKYPWHLLKLTEFFLQHRKRKISKKATIAKTAVVNGAVVIEDGVRVLDHAVINGPVFIGKGSIIGNHALVRESSLGEKCVIGHATEVARSLVADHLWTHKNYIGDSVIGTNVAFGSGAVTGNLRLDEGEIAVSVNGEKINSRRTKLGIMTGNNIRVGINTSFMPGVKIGENSMIGAGLRIGQDIDEDSFVKSATETKKNLKLIAKRQ